MCDDKTSLQEYSPINPDDYSYKSTKQALELISHYLPMQDERHRIGESQRRHFMAHHTYEHRIAKILEIIKK